MTNTLTRELGRSGVSVSAIGLGCWAIGGPYWNNGAAIGWGVVDDNESIRAIHHALDLGITFFDTSDVYGTGHSERVLGQALKGRRLQVVIATKFGNQFDESSRQATGSSADPAYIKQACDASLRRLETDYIDLYQFHLGNYEPEKGEEVRDVLEQLVTAGKIRNYGWSTDSLERVRVFAAGKHCTAVQHQMNVLEDAAPMVALCEEFNLASINRGPLAMGLLTGKFRTDSTLAADDVRGEKAPPWMRYFVGGRPSQEWLAKVDAVREVLTSNGRTPAQGAIAWLWARSNKTVPIPGFRTVQQVQENCGAMKFGPLSTGQMRQIDQLLGR